MVKTEARYKKSLFLEFRYDKDAGILCTIHHILFI
jgi:hypothetical protein